jgi:hypothetical protein
MLRAAFASDSSPGPDNVPRCVARLRFPVSSSNQKNSNVCGVPFVVFTRNGIEGWFKVETVAALHSSGVPIKVRNKGPDLLIGNLSIELKAATNFEASYILGGVKKYRDKYPSLGCLFLGRHPNPTKCREKLAQDRNVQLVGYKAFSDGEHDWIIGLIAPCHYTV